jgi:hypothetical protein
LRGLVGRARESGLAVVLATQGPSDLEAVDRALLPQVLQGTAWQLAFRQGSPQDAARMESLFGQARVKDELWRSDGMVTTRLVERPRVTVDEWMNALEPGDAWLRVAPIDTGWRQERVRVALPTRIEPSDIDSDSNADSLWRQYPRGVSEPRAWAPDVSALAAGPRLQGETAGLQPRPPDCPEDLVERMGADILAKTERRWPRRRHELGPCLVWTGAQTTDAAGRTYGRFYDVAMGRTDYTHRVVWRRVYGPIPPGLQVDHVCEITLCQRPDHLELVTRAENTRRRHQRDRRST